LLSVDVCNGSNRCKLQEQVRTLIAHYERPYLIVEADRVARPFQHQHQNQHQHQHPSLVDPSSTIFKPSSPYLCLTLATLAQTDITVLHTTSQEDSARWLSALGKQESLRGFQLPKADKLTDKQERICQFLRRIPAVNPAVALLMATQFSTLREILQCSISVMAQRCKITEPKARAIHQSFRIHLPS